MKAETKPSAPTAEAAPAKANGRKAKKAADVDMDEEAPKGDTKKDLDAAFDELMQDD